MSPPELIFALQINLRNRTSPILPLIKHLSCWSYSQYVLDTTIRKQTQIT